MPYCQTAYVGTVADRSLAEGRESLNIHAELAGCCSRSRQGKVNVDPSSASPTYCIHRASSITKQTNRLVHGLRTSEPPHEELQLHQHHVHHGLPVIEQHSLPRFCGVKQGSLHYTPEHKMVVAICFGGKSHVFNGQKIYTF